MRYCPRSYVRPFVSLVMFSLATVVLPSGSIASAAPSQPIEITKTADAPTVSAGDQIGYTVTVTNPSNKDAQDVVVTDTLPTNLGTSWSISPAIPDCAISSGELRCSMKKMSGPSSFSVHIVSPTASSTCGVVSNEASVTTKKSGSATSQTATIEVNCADLIVEAITFSAPAGYPPHSYTVTIKNQGAGTANLSGVGVQGYYSAVAGSWPGNTAAGGTSFNSGTTLAAGASVDIVVGNSAAPSPSDDWLVVKVDSGDALSESDETNNVGSTRLPHTDLIVEAITFSAPSNFPPHSYTVTVKNQGNATADLGGVSVQGDYSATEGNFGPYNPAGGQSFNLGTMLAAGASVDIVVGNHAAPPPGANWLVVKVDYGEVLAESDETNNISSTPL